MVLAANIARVREARRLSYIELSRELSKAGRPIPELGLRRIEKGERRVDFDDLMAIAYVLRVCVVDLAVSNEATDEPYFVTPTNRYESASVREWIAGASVILVPIQDPGIFASPRTVMFDALQWMPKARRAHVLRNVLHAEEEDL
jgi:transcriptional regulator with XRE-family HTH domain